MNRSLNTRQQRFCELIAAGRSGTDAWIEAGHKCTRATARANAAAALAKTNIASRVAELRKPQTQAAILAKEETLTFLAQIILTPIREIGPDSPLCAEFSEEVIGGGNKGKLRRGKKDRGNEIVTEQILRRRVKCHDKLRALELYAKLQGYFAPETVVVEDGPEKLKSARERALSIASPLNRLASMAKA